MSKKLIINADDYGACREVNAAIEDLVLTGKVRNVSVLANSWFYEAACDFLLNNRQCSVGVHLNVVEGVALSSKAKAYALLGAHGQFTNLKTVLLRWIKSPLAILRAVETEWREQIELLLKSGLMISHADSHQHIHAFPPFWNLLIRLCREYGIPTIRFPREQNKNKLRRIASFALNQAGNLSTTIISNRGLRTNDHFLGFKRAGAYLEDELVEDLKHLKDGVTELCVHPSLCDEVPYAGLRGEGEYRALLSPEVWKQIAESKIEITTWTEVSRV